MLQNYSCRLSMLNSKSCRYQLSGSERWAT